MSYVGVNAMKPARILFFIEGPAPSPAEHAEAMSIPANVSFRNALAVPNEPHALEICDGVYGKVPPLYAAAFPTAEEAIMKKRDEMQALCETVGDRAAPGSTAEAVQKAVKTESPAPAPVQTPTAAPVADATKAAPASAPAWNPGKK